MSINSSFDGSLNDEVTEPHINTKKSQESESVNQHTVAFESRSEEYGKKFNDQSIDSNKEDSSMYEDFKKINVSDCGQNEFEHNDCSDSFHLSRLCVADSIPHCNKISALISNMGFSSMNILSSDIDPSTSTISTFVVDSWSENVLTALTELQDQVQLHRQALGFASCSSLKQDAGQNTLLQKMENLQNKLKKNEQRERAALLKIKMLEEGKEKKSKTNATEVLDLKNKLKNIECKQQELERRCRTKEIEIERLKQKLIYVAEKERKTNARNKHILAQIKAGEVTFLDDQAHLRLPSSPVASDHSMLSNLSHMSINGGDSNNLNNFSAGRKSTSCRGGGVKAAASPNPKSITSTTAVSLTAVVDALESQRKDLFARNKELELQVRDLLVALKKEQNNNSECSSIWLGRDGHQNQQTVESDSYSSESSGRVNSTAQSMFHRIQQQQTELEAVYRQLELSKAVVAEREETIYTQRQRGQQLHQEVEKLRSELEARPTMRQWTQSQREREQLEERLHDLILLRGEAAEVSMWRKHLSTADRIKVDRRNHDLGLWLLDSLPKTTMKEVVQTVCRELDISEISEVQPCLAKLKAVVKAVPRMERFISQVCGYVFTRHPSLGDVDGMKSVGGSAVPSIGEDGQSIYTMEHMLPILKRWWYAAQRCVELEGFHNRILLELFRRQEMLGRKQALATGAHIGGEPRFLAVNSELGALAVLWESEGKHLWASKDPEQIYGVVHDLVDFQVEVMHHDRSLIYAEDYIRDRPEILVNRIVGHIQYLFEIKTLDGVLPRLNQVYLFVEEMRNFLSTMRSAVQVKPGFANSPAVTNSMLLAEIQRLVTLHQNASRSSDISSHAPLSPVKTI